MQAPSFLRVKLPGRAAAAWRSLGPYLGGGPLVAVAAAAVIWLGLAHHETSERAQILAAAQQHGSNLARGFEEQIVRTLRAVDQTLLYVRDSYQRDPARFDLSLWSRYGQLLTDITLQVSISDAEGRLVASSLPLPAAGVSVADREHFLAQRDATEDALFVSKPIVGRVSGKRSINVSRRLVRPDGSFGGVVIVSLDPLYLSRFYDSVDIGRDGTVALIGLDGIVRARAPLDREEPGETVADGTLFQHLAAAPAGSFTDARRADGIVRLYSYRTVAGFPLVVVVGFAEAELLAGVGSNADYDELAAGVVTLMLLLVAVLIGRHQAGLLRAREELHASRLLQEEKSSVLERTLANISQGIMMIDAARRVLVLNERAKELLGLPPELTRGEVDFDAVLRWQHAQGELEGLDRDASDLLARGGLGREPFTYERRRPNGVVLEVRSIPLPDGGVVRTFTDITLRHEAEAALRRGRDEAARAARAKSEFLANMSHELRTPLNAIIGFSDAMRQGIFGPLQARYAGYASDIFESGRHLLGIINDILDLSKIEAGRLELYEEEVELGPLVDACFRIIRERAEHQGVRLLVGSASLAALPRLRGDEIKLKQLVLNFLSNAVKFTEAGGTVSVSGSLAEGGSIALEIADTGIGMSAEEISLALQPFRQVDNSLARRHEGTGLGLPLAKSLIELHGGSLGIASTPGAGTRITVTFPAERTCRAVAAA